MIIIPENFKANNFTNSDKECKKAFELLRRVYDAIEMSHLNDHKLIPTYCNKFEIKKSLGDDIFNFLQSKDAYFIKNVIRRQKNFRQKQKNKFKNNLKDEMVKKNMEEANKKEIAKLQNQLKKLKGEIND